MTDARESRLEALREENLRLRAALEQALLFAEEVVAGVHEQFEAEALLAAMREALEPEEDPQQS
jgi:hypothetical protein